MFHLLPSGNVQEKGYVFAMSIQSHIDSLAEKRNQIKARIAEESARPAPDFVLITNLKKQNLVLKEEMQRYFAAAGRQPTEATS